MVILTQYHTEIQNRGISTIGTSEIFPVSRMPRFQRLHCIGENIQHNKKQKKLTIKACKILVHMSGQCPDLRE